MKVISVMVFLFLAGCSGYPVVGYYDLPDAINNAETEEEAEHYKERLEIWERNAEKAGEWLSAWQRCKAEMTCVSACSFSAGQGSNYGTDPAKNGVGNSVPELVRWYRITKPPTCMLVRNRGT